MKSVFITANDASFEVRRRVANNEHTARQDFSIIIIAKLIPRRLASKNFNCDKSNLEKLAHRGNSCVACESIRFLRLLFHPPRKTVRRFGPPVRATRSGHPFEIFHEPFDSLNCPFESFHEPFDSLNYLFEILKEPFTRSCYLFGILNNPFSCSWHPCQTAW